MPCSPSKPNIEPDDPPFTFRLKKWLGNQWVDEMHVCAILRENSYLECRGPLFFQYDGWRERMGPIIYIGLRFGNFTFDNLSSSDPMRVGVRVAATYSFNPQKVERKVAGALVTLGDDAFCNVVEGEILRWLRPSIAECTNQQIRRGDVFERINKYVLFQLTNEPDLPRLGITTSKFQIQESLLPQELEEGFVKAARRAVDVQAVTSWENSEFARHLAVILAEKTSGEQFLNAADIFTALGSMDSVKPPPKIIDATPGVPPTTPSGAASASKPADPPASPPPPPKSKPPVDDSFFS